MRSYTYIFLFCLLAFSQKLIYAQDPVMDSLKLALKTAVHDTTRCTILNTLVEYESDDNIWPLYNEQLKEIAEKNLKLKSTPVLQKIYLRFLAGSLNNTGYLARQHGDLAKAKDYYLQSLKILQDIRENEGIALAFNNIGSVYDNQGDILKALEYYHKSLMMYEQIGDKRGIAQSLNNFGIIYYKQKDFTKALEYYNKSLAMREEIQDKSGIALSLNNMGVVYDKINDLPKALDYYLKSLKLREELQDKGGIGFTLNNIGVIYSKTGDFEKALDYYQRSLVVRQQVQNRQGIAITLHSMSSLYFDKGKLAEAFDAGSEALKLAKEIGFPEIIKDAAESLKKIYLKQNKYKEAFKMYALELQMRDSVNNQETRKASVKKQFQYQYEKQAAADSVKHAEEQKVKNAQLAAQNASLKQERTQRYALYGGLFLVIAFLGFVFNRFRVAKKQKLIIEEQKVLVDEAYQSLHEKNKEVMDSITYARRIQRALITPEAYIDKVLNKLNTTN